MLIFVDYSPSDIANQVSLLVLILGAATLGIAAPRWAWLAALVLGGSLAAMHAIYLAARVPLPYQISPPGWAGAATLLILIIPAGIAAYLGAGAHWCNGGVLELRGVTEPVAVAVPAAPA